MRYDDYEILDFIKEELDPNELVAILGFAFEDFVDEIAELILEHKDAFEEEMLDTYE